MNVLTDWIAAAGITGTLAEALAHAVHAVVILGLATLAHFIARRVLLRIVERVAGHTKTNIDDVIVKRRVFHWLAHLVPAIVIRLLAPIFFADVPSLVAVIETASLLYMVVVVLISVSLALNAGLDIYGTTSLSRRVPLKPVVQVIQAIVIFAGIVVGIATLIGQSPAVLLSGLGAFTAVLLLIFRDPILGLAAGIQLISNNMVRKGDWISVPKYGADGDVVDVSLTTVSVQNWDKTISSIPTYSLITDTFKNWRGMEDSGGRRIKRAVSIDMNTIRFADEALIAEMRKVQFLRDYLDAKLEEIENHNREHQVEDTSPANGRRMTNVGTFRAYLEHYLRNHPQVHDEMTFLVRQLDPSPQGLPIEIYVFSRDQRWAHYEAIQGDIFDHVLAVLPLFGLRAFQEPTGADLLTLSATRQESPSQPTT